VSTISDLSSTEDVAELSIPLHPPPQNWSSISILHFSFDPCVSLGLGTRAFRYYLHFVIHLVLFQKLLRYHAVSAIFFNKRINDTSRIPENNQRLDEKSCRYSKTRYTVQLSFTGFAQMDYNRCNVKQWRHKGVRTAPGDTLQGPGDTRTKKIVGKFTINSGQTRSDR